MHLLVTEKVVGVFVRFRCSDSTYIAKKDLPAVDADKLFNLPAGAVLWAVYIWKILLYF
jgi:hypothetical protein